MSAEPPPVGSAADPLHHVRKMCRSLEDTRDHLRRDVGKVDDPLFCQMFEHASLVLDRLVTAFRAYETLGNDGETP